jgi:hypothetical protein
MECKLENGPDAGCDIRDILGSAKTIAVVGISPKEDRPSHKVAKYLIEQGFRVIGVTPVFDQVLGVKCYPNLKSIPEHVDVVDIFRNVEAIPGIVDEAVEIGAGAVWMQLGLEDEKSAMKAGKAGLKVVMNRCIKIEHGKLREDSSESPGLDKGEGQGGLSGVSA